jgi:hypothetical protein
MQRDSKAHLALIVTLAATGMAAQAHAGEAVTLQDSYYGGDNTWNGGDVIGDPSVFSVDSLTAQRVGPGDGTLQITIHTDYANKPGTPTAYGTGYGALFITPGANAWQPDGSAPNYSTDVYKPGEWQYALAVPMDPTTDSGSTALYSLKEGDVVMSNVWGDTITAPYPGSMDGWYFRADQAVQFTPDADATPLAQGSWAVGDDTLTFDIVDHGSLGDDFAVSWAMTCANDVIQGQIDLPSAAPEPSVWAMLIVGVGALGSVLRRRRPAAVPAD